jgi:hypothetical protein
MSLALLVGAGILGCGNIALVLYVGVSVGDALVAYILRVRPLRLLGMVERQRPLLERRAHGLLRWLAVATWVIFSLRYPGFWSSAVALAQAALGAEFKRGASASRWVTLWSLSSPCGLLFCSRASRGSSSRRTSTRA